MDTNKPDTALYRSTTLRRVETAYRDANLMIRAGEAAAQWASQLLSNSDLPILILVGPGNNGGDALEMARWLHARSYSVHVVYTGRPTEHLPPDAASAYQRWREAGGNILEAIPGELRWGLIVDGLFGIGLDRPLQGNYAELVIAANTLSLRHGCPLLALDCPSGLNGDTGDSRGPTIRASHTLTFIAAKPGLYTAEGPEYCGQIRVHSLGLSHPLPVVPDGELNSVDCFAHCFRRRHFNSHKGSHGSVGIVGGAHSMLGAPILTGRAALRLGAGRVFLGLLDPQAPGVDLIQPELMLRRPEGIFDAELTALACGPGLGRSVHAAELLERALGTPIPLVLDADALNLLAFETNLQDIVARRETPVLLTPHPAEAARMLDAEVAEVQQDRITAARALARRYKSWIALKGCGTVIAEPEGNWWINPTGNPGLATAGTGDVLTGMVLALLGQGWPPGEALLAGIYLHGIAADQLVAQGTGPVGLTAGELIDPARQQLNQWLYPKSSERKFPCASGSAT